MKIPLCKPYLPEPVVREVNAKVQDVLRSGHLTQGRVVEEFEELVRGFIGCKYAIAVSNATVGMEIALRVLGVGDGDTVAVPAYTHPATHQVVKAVGAELKVVDVDPDTALMDVSKVPRDVKVVIPVSLFGNPLDSIKLRVYCTSFVLEDAACSLGSSYFGVRTGNCSGAAVFSFHPRKIITTGEGGAVTTNDEGFAQSLREYGNFGGYRSLRGTNAKMSDVNAAIGVVQFKYLRFLLDCRKEIARYYKERLRSTEVQPLRVTRRGDHSYQSFVVLVPDAVKVIREMRSRGIEVQVGSYVLPNERAEVPGARMLCDRAVSLPIYCGMTEGEQRFVLENLLEVV